MSSTMTTRKPYLPSLFGESSPRLIDEIEQAVSRFWGGGGGWFTSHVAASMDVSETENLIEVKIDLPGFKSEEIEVKLSDNILTVSGEHKQEEESKDRTYHRIERTSGSFSRTISLPCRVEEAEVAAEFHDGVLEITLPKAEDTTTRKIAVKS